MSSLFFLNYVSRIDDWSASKGRNGNQILNILDAIVVTDDLESIEIPASEPTLEELEF